MPDDLDVGLGKVVAEAEERLVREPGDGVRQAVAEVERGRMLALAVLEKRVDRDAPMPIAEGDDDEVALLNESGEQRLARDAHASGEDDPCLGQRRRSHRWGDRGGQALQQRLVTLF